MDYTFGEAEYLGIIVGMLLIWTAFGFIFIGLAWVKDKIWGNKHDKKKTISKTNNT